jgi:hypothetical protein
MTRELTRRMMRRMIEKMIRRMERKMTLKMILGIYKIVTGIKGLLLAELDTDIACIQR